MIPMGCLGLHGQQTPCSECGTPRPCLVADIREARQLREDIARVYRENIGHGHDEAMLRVVAECRCTMRFAIKSLRKLKVLP